MSRRVVITGIGMITPVGNDTLTTWEALCAGRSGTGYITSFDASDQLVRIAAEVHDFDPSAYLDRKTIRRTDPVTHFAAAATQQALADAEFRVTERLADSVGVVFGTGVGGMHTLSEQFRVLYDQGPERISPMLVPRMMANAAAGHISLMTGARGPCIATISACATGANAIGEAAEIIRRGDAIAMLAGGAERGITPIGIAAFAATHAVSQRNDDPSHASRPFDAERDGLVIGEGAAVLVLEDAEHAEARGAHIYAELAGYASTADAYHIVEPAPEGAGLARAIRRAIRKAGIDACEVHYINAHGTSTQYNDRTETEAIKHVFGEHAYRLAVSSTKSMIGHTFGAAGAIEAAVTVLSLAHGVLTPTINLTHPDPACDLDYVPNVARTAEVRVALSNSMGFGGHNAALIFRKV